MLQKATLRPRVAWLGAGLLSVITTIVAVDGGIGVWWSLCFALIILVVLAQGTQNLRLEYRLSNVAERRRMLWIVNGFYAAAWIALLIFLLMPVYERFAPRTSAGGMGWFAIGQLLLPLPLLVIVVSLYVGVFYNGALDPVRAIRKTTLYGFIGLAEIFLFGAVEEITASTMLRRFFGEEELYKAFFAGGAVAIGFHPIKHWFERRIGRLFPEGALTQHEHTSAHESTAA